MRTSRKSGIINSLDRIRMTESERADARASLEQGEHIANFILGAHAALVFIAHGVERALRALLGARSVN